MEPRPYQAEAFDAARKDNVVMVGATGVGKELVFQQAKSAQIFTGVRCGPYVGRDLDYWGLRKWREEMDGTEVLVMTPNALLNLLHRGKDYLALDDVGVLVFDECHKARKKHPYARVMGFYKELLKNGKPLPKVVVGELEGLLRMLFSRTMCGFGETKVIDSGVASDRVEAGLGWDAVGVGGRGEGGWGLEQGCLIGRLLRDEIGVCSGPGMGWDGTGLRWDGVGVGWGWGGMGWGEGGGELRRERVGVGGAVFDRAFASG
eukprot:jgi/Undpi1/12007/HiC_scaffold_4.g01706.m1